MHFRQFKKSAIYLCILHCILKFCSSKPRRNVLLLFFLIGISKHWYQLPCNILRKALTSADLCLPGDIHWIVSLRNSLSELFFLANESKNVNKLLSANELQRRLHQNARPRNSFTILPGQQPFIHTNAACKTPRTSGRKVHQLTHLPGLIKLALQNSTSGFS